MFVSESDREFAELLLAARPGRLAIVPAGPALGSIFSLLALLLVTLPLVVAVLVPLGVAPVTVPVVLFMVPPPVALTPVSRLVPPPTRRSSVRLAQPAIAKLTRNKKATTENRMANLLQQQ